MVNGGEFTVGGVDEKQIDFIYDKLKNAEETGDGRKHIDDTVFETDEIPSENFNDIDNITHMYGVNQE